MKVYIVETGCYEQRGVSGVYASREAAIAAHPVTDVVTVPADATVGRLARPGGWQQGADGSWDNGLDWDGFACITEYEVLA